MNPMPCLMTHYPAEEAMPIIDSKFPPDMLKRVLLDMKLIHISPVFDLYLKMYPTDARRVEELSRLGYGMPSCTAYNLNLRLGDGFEVQWITGHFNKLILDDRRGGWNRYILYDGNGNSNESEAVFATIVSFLMATDGFHFPIVAKGEEPICLKPQPWLDS